MTDPSHRQTPYAVRLEWGPTGGAAIAHGADVAVVVDVLSFTTTLCVAVERGIDVLPYRWRDDRAAVYAAEHDAVLAVGRFEAAAREGDPAVTLSPASLAQARGVTRVVLPSPNGSSISFGLAGSGATVVGASLRNRTAVARWLRPRLDDGAVVAVVPAGERWPDGSLRPAAEDLWGTGAVLAALDLPDDRLDDLLSPEALLARSAWTAVAKRVGDALAGCAGGRELAAAGFADDVRMAAEVDAGAVVPVLVGAVFGNG